MIIDMKTVVNAKTQSLIKDSLMFCVLKSVHLEFLNTFPKLDTADLYLLFLSKIIFSQL
jgi:hypothetical protein